MPGRPHVPGENPWHGIVNPTHVHDRTVRGIARSVNQQDGYVTVAYDGLPSTSGRHASVPWLWASFPEQGLAAWGRYMPFASDGLKVSFDYDDTPHIVGYDTRAGLPNVADGKAGYPAINKAAPDIMPSFVPLNSGEFDFMSVGGAYIFGSNDGELLLSAGEVSIDLSRTENTIFCESGTYRVSSTPNMIRYGQVRRTDPTTGTESAVGPWNPSTFGSEFEVNIAQSAGLTSIPVARLAIGNLATDSIIELASTGAPRIVALEVFNPTGTDLFNFEVDAVGNASVTSQTLITITSGIKTSVVSPLISLGPAPTGGVMNGASLTTASIQNFAKLALSLVPALAAMVAGPAAAVPAVKGDIAAVVQPLLDYIKQQVSDIGSSVVPGVIV